MLDSGCLSFAAAASMLMASISLCWAQASAQINTNTFTNSLTTPLCKGAATLSLNINVLDNGGQCGLT
jgi:hypothetical protein